MRIGVDARLLSEPITGCGRYTSELIREMVLLEGKFFLYTPKPPVVCNWNSSNACVRSSWFQGRVEKMIWSQTVLPFWAGRDKVDVFWATTHRLPRFIPSSIARVVTVHDLVWKHAGETMRPLSRWLDSRLMPEAIRLADRVIAVSTSTAEDIKAEYPDARHKVRVVHLGVTALNQPGAFASLASLRVKRPYFLFVGTLEPRKNLRRLLCAFSQLSADTRARAQFVIAGGKGWGGVDIQSLVAELGLERDVLLTGYVSDEQLGTLYAHARFLAMPSIYEGFGLPLVEAMSYGVPVLTSNCSSLPEVTGDAGLLVDPLDEEAIADGLRSLLTDDVLRDTLAKRAVVNMARFSWQKAAAETMAVFAEALAERRSKGKYTC